MPTVFANGRSIIHAKDGQTFVAAPPDVCKTPSPGGPVPVPYVNVAKSSDLAKGTKSVRIEGGAVALQSSHLRTSSGDEPGTAGGGLASSKTKGKMTWGSASADIKFEGKGVARFMDVTQHNGNTFNSAFVAAGGTGFAYGDDGPCPICNKSTEQHRVHELPDVAAMASALIDALQERMRAQRPIIDEHQRLKRERNQVMARHDGQIKLVEQQRTPLLLRRKELIAAKDKDKQALAAIAVALQPLDAELAELKASRKADDEAYLARMRAENAKLAGINVLRMDEGTQTFTEGYMIGVLVCKCPNNPKKIAACSGETTPGFSAAVDDAGFTQVQAFTVTPRQQEGLAELGRDVWSCAAPKLLHAGGVNGHKVLSMSEKYYSPVAAATVTVAYLRNGERITNIFVTGQTVPSCEACQTLTPEMLCDNDKPCA